MPARLTSEVLYLRHEFTEKELAGMALEMGQAHARKLSIDEDKKSMAAQIKERETAVEQTITSLARGMNAGFEMRDIKCSLKWDEPNVGEVSYFDPDGKFIKSRAMTASEQQMEIDFQKQEQIPANASEEQASIEKSQAAADQFFSKDASTVNSGVTVEQASAEDEQHPDDPTVTAEATDEEEPVTLEPAAEKIDKCTDCDGDFHEDNLVVGDDFSVRCRECNGKRDQATKDAEAEKAAKKKGKKS